MRRHLFNSATIISLLLFGLLLALWLRTWVDGVTVSPTCAGIPLPLRRVIPHEGTTVAHRRTGETSMPGPLQLPPACRIDWQSCCTSDKFRLMNVAGLTAHLLHAQG